MRSEFSYPVRPTDLEISFRYRITIVLREIPTHKSSLQHNSTFPSILAQEATVSHEVQLPKFVI